MDDKIVIIYATGRSGSTTLMRILNTIPNSNICGENNGAIINLLEFYRNIKYTTITKVVQTYNSTSLEQIVNERRMSPSWYNSYCDNTIISLLKNMIINLFKKKSANIWGFKEIRFYGEKISYLKEFKELFPQTKVIIHIKKNIAKQSKSEWFAENNDSIKFLKKQNDIMFSFYESHKDFCLFSTFEDMFVHENLRNIFKFIECEEYYDERKIQEIWNDNLG